MFDVINYIYGIFRSNMMDIPLIAPIVDYLMKIPLINILGALILWQPFFAVIIMPGLAVLTLYLL